MNFLYLNQLGGSVPLISCKNKTKEEISSGGTKKVYNLNCDDAVWRNETNTFDGWFTKKVCRNSVIALSDFWDTKKKPPRFRNSKKSAWEKETAIQQGINSPVIYKFGTCDDDPYKNYKIEEKFSGDLYRWLRVNTLLPKVHKSEELVINIKNQFRKVLHQVKFLHDMNKGHLDIKPENILIKINNSGTVIDMTLTDYEFVESLPYIGYKGTRTYIDPSTLVIDSYNRQFTKLNDIYSLGITIYLVFTINKGIPGLIIYEVNVNRKSIINLLPKSSETSIEWINRIFDPGSIATIVHQKYISFFIKEKKLLENHPLFTHLIYKMLLVDWDDKKKIYTPSVKRFQSIDEILEHEFWEVRPSLEKERWEAPSRARAVMALPKADAEQIVIDYHNEQAAQNERFVREYFQQIEAKAGQK